MLACCSFLAVHQSRLHCPSEESQRGKLLASGGMGWVAWVARNPCAAGTGFGSLSVALRLDVVKQLGFTAAVSWASPSACEQPELPTTHSTSAGGWFVKAARLLIERPAFTLVMQSPSEQFPPCFMKAFAMKHLALFISASMPLLIFAGCSAYEDAESTQSNNVTSEVTKAETVDRSNQVLRHAVFFSFNDDASEADVQEVVDAFKALPSKIDSIIDFAWGENNSSEGLDDGFTHCFLLTFKDEAGRANYLPHPDHKAFGAVLGPHKKDVFVIDWWGDAEPAMPEKALHHVVFFKFKDDAGLEGLQAVEAGFDKLPSQIDAIKRFEWGTNNSPETHDDGFTHAFLVTFENVEGLATYLPHPDHLALVEVLKPVVDKVRVLDFDVSK